MSRVRAKVEEQLLLLLREEGCGVPQMSDDLILLDLGLDSLGFAVLVTRLDAELGYDPFTMSSDAVYPRTLGDFVEVYEKCAPLP